MLIITYARTSEVQWFVCKHIVWQEPITRVMGSCVWWIQRIDHYDESSGVQWWKSLRYDFH